MHPSKAYMQRKKLLRDLCGGCICFLFSVLCFVLVFFKCFVCVDCSTSVQNASA